MRIRPLGFALALILLTQSACLLSLDDVREARSIFGDADAQNDMPVDSQDDMPVDAQDMPVDAKDMTIEDMDMSIPPVPCNANEYVEDGACALCPQGSTNDGGDDPNGSDTQCDDACSEILGVMCSQFNEAYIKASNTGDGDSFGTSIALDGDTLAVGAPQEDSKSKGVNASQADDEATTSGAVYVFIRTNGIWTQQAYIKASNAGAGDSFGNALALDGDTLVVGAYGESSNATGVDSEQEDENALASGAAYVFTRSNGTWSQQAYLKASNTGAGDSFGNAIALDGNTLAVSAYLENSNARGINGNQSDENAQYSGAVYMFTRVNDTWSQQAYIKASNTDENDAFGKSIALDGNTLAVSAYLEESNAQGIGRNQANNDAGNSGAVYVFTGSGSNWSQQAYIKASNTNTGDYFGSAIALDDNTLAVGAYSERSNATGIGGNQANNEAAASGAVYVFARLNGTWSQQAYIKASNTSAEDYFGTSVALDGDTLAVGAYLEAGNTKGINGNQANDDADNSGAAYVFTRNSTDNKWSQKAYIKASNTDIGDFFGNAIALDKGTLMICAESESSDATGVNGDQINNSAGGSGAVYVRKIEP